MTKSRYDSLQEFKRPYAHEHPPANNLLDAVKVMDDPLLLHTCIQCLDVAHVFPSFCFKMLQGRLPVSLCQMCKGRFWCISRWWRTDWFMWLGDQALRPTVLIGTSGKGGTFTKAVLEEFASYQEASSESCVSFSKTYSSVSSHLYSKHK